MEDGIVSRSVNGLPRPIVISARDEMKAVVIQRNNYY